MIPGRERMKWLCNFWYPVEREWKNLISINIILWSSNILMYNNLSKNIFSKYKVTWSSIKKLYQLLSAGGTDGTMFSVIAHLTVLLYTLWVELMSANIRSNRIHNHRWIISESGFFVPISLADWADAFIVIYIYQILYGSVFWVTK